MNKLRTMKHSLAARILLAFTVIIILVLSIILGGQILIERKISSMLEKEPVNLGGKTYITDVGNIRVNLARRTVTLRDVTIRTSRAQNTQDGPTATLDMKVPSITASGIRYRRERDNSNAALYLRKVEVKSPYLTFEGIPNNDKDKKQHNKGEDKTSVTVKQFILTNGNTRISRWEKGQKSSYSISGLNINISDIRIGDKTSMTGKQKKTASKDSTNTKQTPYFSSMNISADSVAYTYKNGALTLAAKSLAIDTKSGTILAKRIAIIPQYSKQQYNQLVGDHTDWIYVDISDIAMRGVKLPITQEQKTLYADVTDIGNILIESYKDRNQIQSPKIKPMLYQSIQDIPIGVTIPAIKVADFDLKYQEISRGKSEPGLIDINDMEIIITGLTNRPTATSQTFTLAGIGTFLGASAMNARFIFPASKENNYFTAAISLGRMPANTINQITEPMANIRITDGTIHSANINIAGNSVDARSTVSFLYDDLEVAIQKKHDPSHERGLLTLIANDILIHHNNPENGKIRNGKGKFERDPQKSFWNYIWKTSFAGLKDIVIL